MSILYTFLSSIRVAYTYSVLLACHAYIVPRVII